MAARRRPGLAVRAVRGNPPRGLSTPAQLISPDYGPPSDAATHRTYQTIYPLSHWIDVAIENPYPEGQEPELAATLSAATSGITLVCWEHTATITIANNIMPIATGTQIPQTWPDTRFDVVWMFTRPAASAAAYVFTQVPQMLLADAIDSPIPT